MFYVNGDKFEKQIIDREKEKTTFFNFIFANGDKFEKQIIDYKKRTHTHL